MRTPSEKAGKIVGPLPEVGQKPELDGYPFETARAVRDGYVENDRVKSYYAVFGERGPWLAFAPIHQITHMQMLKAAVPYLSQYFRVVIMDGRGNGRSDRPDDSAAYSFELYYRDFVAVLDAVGAERVALVGISATATTVLRLPPSSPSA